jgi:hypothetical protein
MRLGYISVGLWPNRQLDVRQHSTRNCRLGDDPDSIGEAVTIRAGCHLERSPFKREVRSQFDH